MFLISSSEYFIPGAINPTDSLPTTLVLLHEVNRRFGSHWHMLGLLDFETYTVVKFICLLRFGRILFASSLSSHFLLQLLDFSLKYFVAELRSFLTNLIF